MSLITDLPAIFDQFSEARQKGFLTVMDLKEQNVPLVGTYCTFMPQEIAMAAGAVVVSLCSTSDETIEEAEKDLPRNLCPLIKSSYGFGKTDKCPYFYFSDLVVGETTCDGKKKMYEYMAEFKAVHVMQLPNSASDAASRALWKAEILRLQQVIEARFGAPISEAALREAIVLKNRERRALAHFYRLGQLNPPALSGGDILKVVYGATFRFDKTVLIDELNAMAERIRQEWRQGKRLASRPRILITGCPIGGAAEKVVRAIEENGGWVVGYENCTGAKATERCVAEEGDVYDALTDKYLAIGCSCISPNHQRLQLLSQMVEEYQADGVIDVILQACHTYAVESLAIKRHLRQQHDLPYMAIETDYSTADLGQLSTRVAAFFFNDTATTEIYTVGIDSGSTATKGILLADGVITRRFLCPTPFRPADAIHEAWETLRAGLVETPFLTLTGYGRQLVDFANKQVTEISCHGLGARLLAPDTRTVIDIGGQDSKVIQLDAGGNLSDFLMNDKCAAGTGRFLEVISRTLGASVEQLDAITDGVEPHAITSMCTVFAESEVISLRSAGVAPEAILAGVINAMARRSANFIGRLSAQGPLLFTGGVSHCAAFARMLESHVGMAVTTHPDAQFAGAIGAALIGQRQRRRG